MIIIGLTGSIGMGKSTTAKMFAEAGAATFSADDAVHQLYAKGGKAVPIIRAGLPECIKDEAVDRVCVSEKIKQDPLILEVIESFIHPLVGQMRSEAIQTAKAEGKTIFVDDIPLLFETGGETRVDKIVVVTVPAEVQRERVLSRQGMSIEKFEYILSRQMPDAEKRKRADYIIDTSHGMDFAREQVHKIMSELSRK